MLLENMIVLDGFAIVAIILARIIERKELLVFAGVIILLVGIQLLVENDLQYVLSNTINITTVGGNTLIIQEPIYSQFAIFGVNATLIVALGHFAFGLLIGLKSVGQ